MTETQNPEQILETLIAVALNGDMSLSGVRMCAHVAQSMLEEYVEDDDSHLDDDPLPRWAQSDRDRINALSERMASVERDAKRLIDGVETLDNALADYRARAVRLDAFSTTTKADIARIRSQIESLGSLARSQ